jgi:hypothetical protein
VPRHQHEEEGQDVTAHGHHPDATTEPKSDESGDEVEAHGGGGKHPQSTHPY